jgi:hypothetical protein
MKRSLLLLLVIAVPAILLAGEDVWKSKPYQQWDIKDVQKVLNDSPWAKVVHVDAKWRSAGSTSPADRTPQSPDANTAPRPSSSGTSSNPMGGTSAQSPSSAQTPRSPQDMPSGNAPQTSDAPFVVRWFSSKTIREAIARAQVLNGGMSEADAEKALTQEPGEYTISIAGADMSPFQGAEEKDLASSAYLEAKKEKTKVAASHVKVEQSKDAKGAAQAVSVVVFYFPKKDASGQPTLPPTEKGVEFACAAKGSTIKTSFDLAKMRAASGPDW